MKLKDLLKNVDVIQTNVSMELNIDEIFYDSRKVTSGSMFVAVTGFATDGNRYIPMAMEKGAAVVVTAVRPNEDIPYVLVKSDRYALAQISCNYFGHPSNSMTMIGVTGTNGKTSVTLLLKQLLEKTVGAKVGLIGTMENRIGDAVIPTERTTPESYELQALFAQMRTAGCTHVVMEVSSHAISLDRVAGVHFDVAAFTNLTEDHLDFHKTMEAYCDAKAQLFARCEKAVFNADDSWYPRISQSFDGEAITFALNENAVLTARDVQLHADGVSFTAAYNEEIVEVNLPIPGKFTVYNAMTVLAIALQLGISLVDSAAALTNAKGVKGRVEVVPTPGKPYTVLIDYAHTPDGLHNVLSSVRGFCKGQLIAVFGCGGDRDPMKRPIMGKIGVQLSDFAVITSDNPRTEDPMAIISDIVKGVDAPVERYTIIENRRKAIRYAMDKAGKNDIIVLAGKGHETYQEIQGIKHHLDEREEVAAYLEEMRM